MWHYPEMDPVAISFGLVNIHWYAISYLVGIALAWWLLLGRTKLPAAPFNEKTLSDLVFYIVLGLMLGGRLGYILFYGWSQWLLDPWSGFRIWQGGMSFHGGLMGALVAVAIFNRRSSGKGFFDDFFKVTDFIAPAIPLALGAGRIGNFVNAELPGRMVAAGVDGSTTLPWAVIYPGELIARHPSSLYQALLEGPVLFAILWVFSRRARPGMTVSGLFLLGYGSLRIFSEFFREPDAHLGFILLGKITAGQLLSMPMLLLGIFLLIYGYRKASK